MTDHSSTPQQRLSPELLSMVVCPVSKGPLRYDSDAQELISPNAKLAYPIRDGIPIMLEAEARKIDDQDATSSAD